MARALAQAPLDADIVLVGPEDQIAGIPSRSKVGVGTWGTGKGQGEAGQLAGRSIERAVWLARGGEADAVVTGPVH